jgi:hypothetical protein
MTELLILSITALPKNLPLDAVIALQNKVTIFRSAHNIAITSKNQ